MRAAGLKFDDLMIEEDPDVAEAVRRLTPEQQLARKRRQLRAFDISLKKTPLPDHIQAVQDPFEVGTFTSAGSLGLLFVVCCVVPNGAVGFEAIFLTCRFFLFCRFFSSSPFLVVFFVFFPSKQFARADNACKRLSLSFPFSLSLMYSYELCSRLPTLSAHAA